MNMDTNKKYTLPRAIILAACSLLLAGACDTMPMTGWSRILRQGKFL